MNHQQQNLLPIGSFSSASRLSIKALRLYDQLGILKPSYVDPESSYRYYQAKQLREARLIRMMRQIDMPLAIIRQVLSSTPIEAEALVHSYWQAQENRISQGRLLVPGLISYVKQEVTAMTLEVNVKIVQPQRILSLTDRVTVERLDEHISSSLETLYSLVGERNSATGSPFGIYHGPINHDDDGPIEVCIPVEGQTAKVENVASRELSSGQVAYVMLYGDQCRFPAILAGYDAVFDWIRHHGYEIADSPREIWHGQSGEDDCMEVALPFRSAAS
ncbi:MerR family transcriptional regulator [Nodosilinea sp. LEGE 07088]|uniref:MerR family transcriptional regulator n=1 Tax=Nodosilinea sp. LEGE 07088 TaxID=2777968 RepID=UPI00187F2AAA|nr:MerR family transcriptional regulator [Nodosilinea sp. LEGE 07088]MBE9138249.1 MerR family transcriptional regulator [Nodosilinea sp. LEGE 07088]